MNAMLPPGLEPPKPEPKLTAKQRAFIDEYLVDFNGTQAAIRAGYSEKTANVIAAENLAKPYIAEIVAKQQKQRSKKAQIDAEWILRQAVKLHKRCMQEVKPKMSRSGPVVDENGNPVYEFNAAGAAKALELAGKHVNIQAFRDQVHQTGELNLIIAPDDAEL